MTFRIASEGGGDEKEPAILVIIFGRIACTAQEANLIVSAYRVLEEPAFCGINQKTVQRATPDNAATLRKVQGPDHWGKTRKSPEQNRTRHFKFNYCQKRSM